MNLNRNHNLLYLFSLFVFFSIVTVVSVGSFDSRLANSIGDDHPMVWARMVLDPAFWQGDGGYSVGSAFARASLPNLLASIAIQFNENLPRYLSWLYLFIQNVGVGLALYFFSKAITKDPRQSVFISLLAFLFTPWGLNLAYYPSMMYSPYPGHLALPFLIFGAYFLFSEQMVKLAASLTVAGFIHPSQTLHFVAFALTFLALSQKNILKSLIYFVGPVLSAIAIPLVFIKSPTNPLTDAELIPSALNNPHLVPWTTNIFWPWGVPTMAMIFATSYVAARDLGKEIKSLVTWWWANFLCFVVMAICHVVGARLQILPIILLCPLRITVINSVFLTPIIFVYLLKLLKGESRASAFVATTVAGLMLFSKRGLFWGPLAVLAFIGFNKKGSNHDKKIWAMIIVWWLVMLISGRPLRSLVGADFAGMARNVLAPGFSLTNFSILCCLVLGVILGFYSFCEKKVGKIASNALIVFVGAVVLYDGWLTGKVAFEVSTKSNWDLQKWAKNSTPKESIFLMESGSWRGVSERRVFLLKPQKNGILPYMRNREPLVFQAKLAELYKAAGAEKFDDLTTSDALKIAREFNGTFWVDKNSVIRKNLPVVYEDQIWRVYQLKNY